MERRERKNILRGPPGSLSGSASPRKGSVQDCGPRREERDYRLSMTEDDALYTPKAWVVDLSSGDWPNDVESNEIEPAFKEEVGLEDCIEDCFHDERQYVYDDTRFARYTPLSPVIESPNREILNQPDDGDLVEVDSPHQTIQTSSLEQRWEKLTRFTTSDVGCARSEISAFG